MARSPDIVIFGAGIAGLWLFNYLKKLKYDTVLFEKNDIGGFQSIASQGIIHSGLKFSLAGKINTLADSISKMPERWKNALNGDGEIDLSGAHIHTQSQQLLIPSGFMGGVTKLITQKALGCTLEKTIPDHIKNTGFTGSIVSMNEPVIDVPSVIHALAEPYKDHIKKTDGDPFEFLNQHDINPKAIIFTSAAANQDIASAHNHDKGLETQQRPLLQGMIKNAPFPLYAHFVGKTRQARCLYHNTQNGRRRINLVYRRRVSGKT